MNATRATGDDRVIKIIQDCLFRAIGARVTPDEARGIRRSVVRIVQPDVPDGTQIDRIRVALRDAFGLPVAISAVRDFRQAVLDAVNGAKSGGPAPRVSAPEDILARMMDELGRNGWPTEETWADACRVLGREVPVPLERVAGEPTGLMDVLARQTAGEVRSFVPQGRDSRKDG